MDTSLLLALAEGAGSHVGGLLTWVGRVQSKVLESPARLSIMRIAFDRPGISVTELAGELEMSWGQLNYHLTRLSDAGLLHTIKAGRHRLVFPEKEPGEQPEDRAMVLERTARALALLIVDNPHVRATELVHLSGESARVVYYHVKRLIDAGLVSSASGIHHRGLVATPRLVHILGSLGVSGGDEGRDAARR